MSITVSRRMFLRGTVSTAVTAPYMLRNPCAIGAQSGTRYPDQVVRLVRESTVVDMLNQFLYRTDKQSTLDDWLSKPNAFTSSDYRLLIAARPQTTFRPASRTLPLAGVIHS